jgi:hypothetical protein
MQLSNSDYSLQWFVVHFSFSQCLFLLSRHYPHLSFAMFGPVLQSEEIMIHFSVGLQFLVMRVIVGHGDTPVALTLREQTVMGECLFMCRHFMSLNLYFSRDLAGASVHGKRPFLVKRNAAYFFLVFFKCVSQIYKKICMYFVLVQREIQVFTCRCLLPPTKYWKRQVSSPKFSIEGSLQMGSHSLRA